MADACEMLAEIVISIGIVFVLFCTGVGIAEVLSTMLGRGD